MDRPKVILIPTSAPPRRGHICTQKIEVNGLHTLKFYCQAKCSDSRTHTQTFLTPQVRKRNNKIVFSLATKTVRFHNDYDTMCSQPIMVLKWGSYQSTPLPPGFNNLLRQAMGNKGSKIELPAEALKAIKNRLK